MAHVDKLDKMGVKTIGFLLYKHNDNEDFINQIITKFSLDNLIKTKNNGIISNLLSYYILTNNNEKIEEIIRLVDIHSIYIMKRDYLNLAKYYYKINIDKSVWFFKQILSKVSLNTDSVILPKDLDFIINNKLYSLLKLLSGLFIETSINSQPLINGCDRELKLQLISPDIIDNIKNHIDKIFGDNIIKQLDEFVSNQDQPSNTNIDAIIDGGNVIHSQTGFINSNSLSDLENIIALVKKHVGNPLLVIHCRHLKTCPNLISCLDSQKISYYLTPYNMNDDNFIIWFFLNYKSKPFIISNDQYRDHIFKFETSKKSTELEYGFSQFSHIIQQQTLGYNLVLGKIESKPTYSRCIQVINNLIYIPHESGQFIELKNIETLSA
jgi:hypothetical protein